MLSWEFGVHHVPISLLDLGTLGTKKNKDTILEKFFFCMNTYPGKGAGSGGMRVITYFFKVWLLD